MNKSEPIRSLESIDLSSCTILDKNFSGVKFNGASFRGTRFDNVDFTGATFANCDFTARIPMAHGVDSLNVAAAGAVAFWTLCRRRAGE